MLSDLQRTLRCSDCRAEYPEPPRGELVVCPTCGSRSWVAARIPAEPPVRVTK